MFQVGERSRYVSTVAMRHASVAARSSVQFRPCNRCSTHHVYRSTSLRFFSGDERQSRNEDISFQINKRLEKLGSKNDWSGILAFYREHAADFSSVNFATALSRLARNARAHHRSVRDEWLKQFIDDLGKRVQKHREEPLKWMRVRDVANIAHSMGKLRYRSKGAEPFFQVLASEDFIELVCSEGETNPQAVSNIVWTLARLRRKDIAEVWRRKVEAYADRIVSSGRPQEISNILWAFASLLSALLDGSHPQAIRNIAWSCARMGLVYPRLFAEIDRRSIWIVAEASPDELASIAWSFARTQQPAPKLLPALEDQATWLVQGASPLATSKILWACAKLRAPASNLHSGDRQYRMVFCHTWDILSAFLQNDQQLSNSGERNYITTIHFHFSVVVWYSGYKCAESLSAN